MTKYNFLWSFWFLAQNLAIYVSFFLKLDNLFTITSLLLPLQHPFLSNFCWSTMTPLCQNRFGIILFLQFSFIIFYKICDPIWIFKNLFFYDSLYFIISKSLSQFILAYLWGILGQWDVLLLNLTSIGFKIFLDVSSLTVPFLQILM